MTLEQERALARISDAYGVSHWRLVGYGRAIDGETLQIVDEDGDTWYVSTDGVARLVEKLKK